MIISIILTTLTFKADTVRRNWKSVTLRGLRVNKLVKIFHLPFKCILIIWSHVRGLDSSINIMDHVLITDMLVIEVNIVFSMVNGFTYKYMYQQQAIIL